MTFIPGCFLILMISKFLNYSMTSDLKRAPYPLTDCRRLVPISWDEFYAIFLKF